MEILKALNLLVRFLLELCMLAAVGYWGVQTGASGGMKLLFGLGLPTLVALGWWLAWRLRGVSRLFLELTLLGSGAVALFASNKMEVGWVYTAIVVINKLLLIAWKQEIKVEE